MSLLSALFSHFTKLPKALTQDIRVSRNIKIPMSDGIKLIADLYQPELDKPLPTMLVRSPYGKGFLFSFLNGTLVAERGFNVVFQCIRGTHGSEGKFTFLVDEESDGNDTVEWIKQQDWFNGELSTMGLSYLGYAQWAIAANHGSLLKTMNICVSTSSFYKMLYMGDSLNFEGHFGWTAMMKDAHLGKIDMTTSSEHLMQRNDLSLHLPLQTADETGIGRKIDIWQDAIKHGEPPYSYWEKTDHSSAVSSISAEVNFTTGWFDIFLPWNFDDYELLVKAGHKPVLTIGPWSHTSPPLMIESLRQTLTYTDSSDNTYSPVKRELPVRIIVLGSKRWKEFSQWPPTQSRQQHWYLQANFGLAPTLSMDSEPDTYVYDPRNPTPNLGGALMNKSWGQKDNRKLEARSDVLLYTGEELAQDFEIIGYVSAVLYIQSSLQNTDFFVRLCDVLPNGKSLNICDGLQRIRPSDYQVDENGIIKLEVRMWPTAYCFKQGHKIRVQVSSGAHPRFARNIGSGEPMATGIKLVSAEQAIHHNKQYPSAIILPVMPS